MGGSNSRIFFANWVPALGQGMRPATCQHALGTQNRAGDHLQALLLSLIKRLLGGLLDLGSCRSMLFRDRHACTCTGPVSVLRPASAPQESSSRWLCCSVLSEIDTPAGCSQQRQPTRAVCRLKCGKGPSPITAPLPSPSRALCRIMAAASSGVSMRAGAAQPLRRVKNAGNSSAPYAATHTPCACQKP